MCVCVRVCVCVCVHVCVCMCVCVRVRAWGGTLTMTNYKHCSIVGMHCCSLVPRPHSEGLGTRPAQLLIFKPDVFVVDDLGCVTLKVNLATIQNSKLLLNFGPRATNYFRYRKRSEPHLCGFHL